MEVADTFLPTAGAVGVLPMVTYFSLVVTLFVCTGNFVFSLTLLPGTSAKHRFNHTLSAIVALIAAFTYYLLQTYYRDILSDLATVTENSDRQTLIRESYNAIGQYRYVNWFVAGPLVLLQLTSSLTVQLKSTKRPLAALLVASLFLFFFSYVGHQQLSFDNEIQIGAKAGWGLLAIIAYGFIILTLNRSGKQFSKQVGMADQRSYQQLVLIITACWGTYLLGYFLTLTTINFNWIHLLFTLADLLTVLSISITTYWAGIDLSN